MKKKRKRKENIIIREIIKSKGFSESHNLILNQKENNHQGTQSNHKSKKTASSFSLNCLIFIYLTLVEAQIRRVASGGAGGKMPPRFSFLPPPIYFLPPRYFLGGKSCFFWLKKTLKFVISVRKSLRISAKTFFLWRSPAFGQKKT